MTLGQKIKALRTERGMTQEQLAEAIYVTRAAISKWETGNGLPDAGLMLPLSGALGITVNELLSGQRLEDGQYNRDWSTIHLMPVDWRRAAAELAPAALLPCHNSKYDLSRHVWTDPLERAAASSEALGIALATPMIGEAFPWARAETASRRWWPAVP